LAVARARADAADMALKVRLEKLEKAGSFFTDD